MSGRPIRPEDLAYQPPEVARLLVNDDAAKQQSEQSAHGAPPSPPAYARVKLSMTVRQLGVLIEALDSHTYWQLSEPEHRNDGAVTEEGETEEIRYCNRLADKLSRARDAAK